MNGQAYTNLRKIRGLVAFSRNNGQAAIIPTQDGKTTLPHWRQLSPAEQGTVILANAAAAEGDWPAAENALMADGFKVGIR
jgi:hypothetical protein